MNPHNYQIANVKSQMRMRSKVNEQEQKMTRHQKASKAMGETRKRRERGRKKRGSNRGKSISTLRDIINFFFSKTATQRAAQDIAADAAGPPIHLTK
jgi:hypothetical protein